MIHRQILAITLLSFLSACITTQRGESKDLLEQADTALALAQSLGHVWRIPDPATGNEPEDLDRLLEIAKEKHSRGDYGESQRMAKRIIQAARKGTRQARRQATVTPHYPQ